MVTAATCDEQDAWTDEVVAYSWLVPTPEDGLNVLCYREMNHTLDSSVGYIFH